MADTIVFALALIVGHQEVEVSINGKQKDSVRTEFVKSRHLYTECEATFSALRTKRGNFKRLGDIRSLFEQTLSSWKTVLPRPSQLERIV